MIKLKTILSEGYAWEREAGKPLPTLADTTEAHAGKLAEQSDEQALSNPIQESNGDFVADCADYFGMTEEAFEQQVMRSGAEFDVIERIMNSNSMTSEEAYATIADMVNLPMPSNEGAEGARPDFLDLDGDGNEEESMKAAAASVNESLEQRIKNNFRGHEYILSEAFRSK
jgi:hypothetical protein